MSALPKQIIPIKFAGLDTSKDPKTGASGRLSLLENAQAIRDTDGGIELRKWPGSASFSRTIISGGSISAGCRISALNGQLVMTDGTWLYRWASAPVNQWMKMGRLPEIAAARADVTSAIGTQLFTADATAISGGIVASVASDATGTPRTTYYVQDANGAVIALGSITNAIKPRIVTNSTDAFIFYQNASDGFIYGRTITAAAPTTLGAAQSLATDANATCHFDVIWDPTNSRFLLAYRNTTPALAVVSVSAGLVAGSSFTVARDPDKSLGFLLWDFSNGSGYLAICASASGVRRIVFDAVAVTFTSDTLYDGSATACERVDGYYNGVANIHYEIPGSTTGATTRIDGANGTTLFNVRRGLGMASKIFKVGTRYYFAGLYNSDTQGHLVLIEFDSGFSGSGGALTLAGHLLAGDAGARSIPDAAHASCLGHAAVNGSSLVFVHPRQLGLRQAPGVVSADSPFALSRFDLTWGAANLGEPVTYNGALYFPGAIAKMFDGEIVSEVGTVVAPEPATNVTQTTGGSLTTTNRYQFCAVFQWWDNANQRWQSNVGPITALTLTGSNNKITWDQPTLRLTDRLSDNFATANLANVIDVRICIYATAGNGSSFHKVFTIQNTGSADTTAVNLNVSDATILAGEELYTDTGEVENDYPPMVAAYVNHRDRLVAISNDGAMYPSKETRSGEGVGFSVADGFFLEFDPADGAFTGAASDGTTLFVSKRSRVFVVAGDGPSLDGNNGYGAPQPLPSEEGFLGPRGFCGTPDGIVFKSAKGFRLLDRGGGIQPVPAPAAYDSLTITGAAVTDDRPMAYFFTAEGRTLAYDWRLKQWYATSSGRQPAGAACRWTNQVVYLKSDGTVVREAVGTWGDDGAAYTMKVELAWEKLQRARIYRALIIGEAAASCTLSASVAYDFDPTLSTAKTIALTTASPRAPWEYRPSRQWLTALLLHLEETSTGEGVRLSEIDLEVAIKQGAAKYGAGRVLT